MTTKIFNLIGNNEVINVEEYKSDTENCFTDRRAVATDRRSNDRRANVDRRSDLDRRRGPGRRRSEDRKAAEEGQMTDEQFEFVMAVDQYKKLNSRPFPSWTEILEILKTLGYRKVKDSCSIKDLQDKEASESKH
jgi:hypothetical protein